MAEISVVVPVYNTELYIEKCLRSLCAQTFQDIEIIVVNDGSTDSSVNIIQRYAKKDKRIHLYNQKNEGVSVARNNGIAFATGRYLTFVDSDDWLRKDCLEKIYKKAVETDADMLISGASFVTPEGKILKQLIPKGYKSGVSEEWVCRISATWAHLYKRSLWDQYDIRFMSDGRGEDIPVAVFFGAICEKIVTLPYAGYCYVQHQDSAMHHFKGLKDYNLPYLSLENSIQLVQKNGIKNGKDFHELFILRILCTFLFQLARGSSFAKKKELWAYICHILDSYYPDYAKNPLISLRSGLQFPIAEKIAVLLLVTLVRLFHIHKK